MKKVYHFLMFVAMLVTLISLVYISTYRYVKNNAIEREKMESLIKETISDEELNKIEYE